MNANRTDAVQLQPSGGASYDEFRADSESRLRVSVVCTTREGTLAALKAAAELAKHLGAAITVMATQLVPLHFTLDRPHVAIEILKQRYSDWVREAGIEDEPVAVRILLCRDSRGALKQALPAHSLVVIGGKVRWWRWNERRLAQWLRKRGHFVVFVDAEVKQGAANEADGGRQAAFYRLLASESRSRYR